MQVNSLNMPLAWLWLIARGGILAWAAFFAVVSLSSESSNLQDTASSATGELPFESTGDEVRRLIEKLGSSNYRTRQASFLELWSIMKGAGHDIEQKRSIDAAMQSTDLDVAASARWLRVLTQLSATPEEAARLIEDLMFIRSGDFETVLRLARNHRWDELQAALGALSNADRQRLLSEPDALSGPRAMLLSMAWNDHQEHRIPELVDRLWSNEESLAARRLWHELGLEEWSRQRPIDSNDNLWRIAVDEMEGRIEDAVAQARKSGFSQIADDMLITHGRWEEAIPAFAMQPPPANTLTSGQQAIEAARVALLLRWSGEEALSRAWLASIEAPGPRESDVSGVLMALCLCDRIDAALTIARKRLPDEAYDCLMRQGDIEEALACIGIEDIDEESVDKWLRVLMDKPPSDHQAEVAITSRLANTGTLFHRLGRKDLAKIVDQACVHWASSIHADHDLKNRSRSADRSAEHSERWKGLFEVWKSQHRRPLALSHLKQLLREGLDDESRGNLLQVLFANREYGDLHVLAVPALLWFRQQREGSWEKGVDDLEEFFMGRTPLNWPTDWRRSGFRELGENVFKQSEAESVSEMAIVLARMALLHSRPDLAKIWLERGAENGYREWTQELFSGQRRPTTPWQKTWPPISLTRLAMLGEILVHQQEYEKAAFVFDYLSSQHPERVDLGLRHAEYLRRIGEVERGNQRRLQTLSIPLAPLEVRIAVSNIEKNKLVTDAEFLLRYAAKHPSNHEMDRLRNALQLSMLGHQQLTIHSGDQTNLSSEERRSLVVKILDDDRRHLLSRLSAYPIFTFDMQYSLMAVEALHRTSAHRAIIDGDFEAADRAVRACHAADPDQIETLIELMPLAEKAFGKSSVEPWFELYASKLEEHLAKWPDDTLIGNNLAWLYANLDRRLDRALELSRRVAELLPDDSVYLDTLAEVEFRRGNVARAIELSSRCRRINPLESHHRTQLYRFFKAKNSQGE